MTRPQLFERSNTIHGINHYPVASTRNSLAVYCAIQRLNTRSQKVIWGQLIKRLLNITQSTVLSVFIKLRAGAKVENKYIVVQIASPNPRPLLSFWNKHVPFILLNFRAYSGRKAVWSIWEVPAALRKAARFSGGEKTVKKPASQTLHGQLGHFRIIRAA